MSYLGPIATNPSLFQWISKRKFWKGSGPGAAQSLARGEGRLEWFPLPAQVTNSQRVTRSPQWHRIAPFHLSKEPQTHSRCLRMDSGASAAHPELLFLAGATSRLDLQE
jgi:hypothetical protein